MRLGSSQMSCYYSLLQLFQQSTTGLTIIMINCKTTEPEMQTQHPCTTGRAAIIHEAKSKLGIDLHYITPHSKSTHTVFYATLD